MGLFDIFRRRAKKKKQEASISTTESVSQSSVSTNESILSASTGASATTQQTSTALKQSVSETSLASQSSLQSSNKLSQSTRLNSASQQSQTQVSDEVSQSMTKMNSANQSVSSSTDVAASLQMAQSTISQSTQSEASVAAESTKEAKYEHGLAKSRHGFGARLNRFLANFRHVDEDFFDNLEDLLIESDVGYEMTMKLSDELREEVKLQNAKSRQAVSNVIIEKMVDLYEEAGKGENPNINFAKTGPTVILFVGVNGAGKTTTIGKMAAMYHRQGKKVLLAAADTFRAGAVEQLEVWAKRDNVDLVKGPEKGDPAAVVYDAVTKAKRENYDVLFVDTAGRLQNKVNLMKELSKMKRVLTREIPEAPHEVLLVLDATTGQNALNQAKDFQKATDVTGIVLTKLDGTARGGIVLAIRNELHLPVKYVGLGEHVDDLQKFDANEFIYGLFKGLVTTEE